MSLPPHKGKPHSTATQVRRRKPGGELGFSRRRLLHVECFPQAPKGTGSPGRAVQCRHAQFSGWKWARAAFPHAHVGIGPPVFWRRTLGLLPGQPEPSDHVKKAMLLPAGPPRSQALRGRLSRPRWDTPSARWVHLWEHWDAMPGEARFARASPYGHQPRGARPPSLLPRLLLG